MEIEAIFRKVPDFHDMVLDVILFESRYPVMFTCKKGDEVYLFICCFVTADQAEWIGTRTTYENLIDLLENKITIRDAFLNITDDKIIIDYNGKIVDYRRERSRDIPKKLLPAAGEYMDAEEGEYAEELSIFKRRNTNVEYVIQPKISKFWEWQYSGKRIWLSDDDFPLIFTLRQCAMEEIYSQKIVFG